MSSSLDNYPAGVPPPGVKPNFIDPETQAPTIEAFEGVFMSLMILAVAVRLYVRARITKVWGWDDYSCLLAAAGSIAHMIAYTQMIDIGYGRHLYDFRASTLSDARNFRVLTSNGVIYPWTIFFARISILLLYLRIFGIDRQTRIAVVFGIVFQALFYTALLGVGIGSMVECIGLAALMSQFCQNVAHPVVTLGGVVNAICDFYVLLLPLYRISRLQLSFKNKMGLIAVFSGGLVACAASLARLINFQLRQYDSDLLWIQATNTIFTIVEINLAIIVACATAFPPFFARTKVFSTHLLSIIRIRLSDSNNNDSTYRRTDPNDPSAEHKSYQMDSSNNLIHPHGSKIHVPDNSFPVLRGTGTGNRGGVGATVFAVGGARNRSEGSGFHEGVESESGRRRDDGYGKSGTTRGIVRTMDYDVETVDRL